MRFLFVLFISISMAAQLSAQQGRKPFQGKVSIGSLVADESEINVKNLQTQLEVPTQAGGFFTIDAKVGDTLQFSGAEINVTQIALRFADLEKDLMPVVLEPKDIQLKTVTIDQSKTAKSLGLGGQKEYSPAERKLATAKRASPQRDDKTAITAVGTDPLLNSISGRTAALKKQAEVERKEELKLQLTELYDRKHFTDSLQIPEIDVEGFLFFAVEDKTLQTTFDSKQQTELDFQLSALATKYKNILKGDGR